MRAMVLDRTGEALRMADLPRPDAGPGQVLIEVTACGVCRTDLHIVDGDLPALAGPTVPGHEIVGRVAELGDGVDNLQPDPLDVLIKLKDNRASVRMPALEQKRPKV